MKSLPKSLIAKLQQRTEANALRSLPVANGLVDFSSNDYLGFSQSAEIFQQAHQYLLDANIISNGSTGSRLITGNHNLYKVTEDFIARFHNSPSALIFNSGYDANVGFFSSVPQKEDIVLYDEYIHASIRDGLRLSNAKAFKFRHNDLNHLENLLKRYSAIEGEVYVVTESVFSMDGDTPDLVKLVAVAEEYNSRLVIDEAHALGMFGAKGEGLVQELNLQDRVFARIMTFGKGLGCHGAAVLGDEELRTYLVNFARSFIYTTALPPHSLAVILTAYKHLENGTKAKKQLRNIITFFNKELERLAFNDVFIFSESAIHCAIIPGNNRVKQIAEYLQQNGFNVKPILSPTVPQGQERLRFCLHSFTTRESITRFLNLLQERLVQF
ncbi:aminotransferase class I/II-fold pyridoxal phosphate-dependent enzyme [Flavobacterium beibuense]|nr:8-amino-7-oxononanoate synthase [Flavobacterium beibuense]